MIIVKVTYTVKQAFAQQNKENIARFMQDFKAMNDNGFRYNAYVCSDGKTFVHLSTYQNEAIQQTILNTPSFIDFQQQRDDSGLEGTPQIEVMNLVAASHQLL